jgi:hypothetical protein
MEYFIGFIMFLLLLVVLRGIQTGTMYVKSQGMYRVESLWEGYIPVYRDKEPIKYWFIVLVYLSLITAVIIALLVD